MPGMGLLRRRCTDVTEPSEEALDVLDDLNAAMRRVDGSDPGGATQSRQEPSNALLEAINSTMAQVQQALVSEDALGAFRLLEAAVMFIQQEENLVSGLPESTCSTLMRLIFAGYVASLRQLVALGQLDSQTIPNYKYVINRVIECGENFSGLCSAAEQGEGSSLRDGPRVLQALLDGSEEELQACEGDSSLDFEAQWELYKAQAPVVGFAPAAAYDDAQQQLLAELPPNAELSGDDDDVGALGVQGMTHNKLEDALQLHGLLTQRLPPVGQEDDGEGLGNEPGAQEEGDVAQQQQQGRLAALDDPVLRPMLLRTVQRLEEGHAVRLEVEQEVGGAVGSAAYRDALLEAEASALAAGVPPPAQQQAGSIAAGASNGAAATGSNPQHALPPALVPFGLGALTEFSMEGALPSPAANDDGAVFLQPTNSALRSIEGSGSIRGMLGSEATSASSAAAAAAAAAGLLGAAGGNALLDGSSSVMLFNNNATDGSALQGASQSLLLPLHSAAPAVGSAGNGTPTALSRGDPSSAPFAHGLVGEPSLGAFSSASFAFMNNASVDLAEDSAAQLMGGGGRSTDGTDWLRQPFNSAVGSDGRADSIGGLVGSPLGGGGGEGELLDSDNWFASEVGDGGGEAGLWAGSLDALEASVDAGGGNAPGSNSLLLGKRPPGVLVGGGAVPRRPSKLSRVS